MNHHGLINFLTFQIYYSAEWAESANKTDANNVCWVFSGIGSEALSMGLETSIAL